MKGELRCACFGCTSGCWRNNRNNVDVVVLCPNMKFVFTINCEIIGNEPMCSSIICLQDGAVVIPWIHSFLLRPEIWCVQLISAVSDCPVMRIAVRDRLGLGEL